MKNPKISVCIPAFNAECWLAEAVNSIVIQTFTDWEILILDDASDDSTWLVASHYQRELRDKIRIFQNDKNKGIASSRNFLNSKARGEIICVQDADDLSHRERLKKTWAFMKRHQSVDIVYGAYQVIDALSKPQVEEPAQPFDEEKLRKHNYIAHPTVAYRRQTALETPYRDYLVVLDDWFLYLDLMNKKKKFAPLEEVLAFYRTLPTGVSVSRQEEIDVLKKKFLEEANADHRPLAD